MDQAALVLNKVSEISVAFRSAWHSQQLSLRSTANSHRQVAKYCSERLEQIRTLREALKAEDLALEQQYSLSANAAEQCINTDRLAERDVMKTMKTLESVGDRSSLEKEEKALAHALKSLQDEEAQLENWSGDLKKQAKDLTERKQLLDQLESQLKQKRLGLLTKQEERLKLVKSIQEREKLAHKKEEQIERWQRMLDNRDVDLIRLRTQVERKLEELRLAELSLAHSQQRPTHSKSADLHTAAGGSENTTADFTTNPAQSDANAARSGRSGIPSTAAATAADPKSGILSQTSSLHIFPGAVEAIEKDDDDDE